MSHVVFKEKSISHVPIIYVPFIIVMSYVESKKYHISIIVMLMSHVTRTHLRCSSIILGFVALLGVICSIMCSSLEHL